MTLAELEKEGYKLRMWTRSKTRGDKLAVTLTKRLGGRTYHYITFCCCDDTKLGTACFADPIILDNTVREDLWRLKA